MASYYTWPSRKDGGDGHKHQADATERRTLCGQRIGDWLRGELESPGERCTRCEAAALNLARADERADVAPVRAGGMVSLRRDLRRALARADWAADAFWSAGSDDAAAVASARARVALAEVDALYSELRGVLASVAGDSVAVSVAA